MHMYIFVFDQNTPMTEMTLKEWEVGDILFLVPMMGETENFKSSLGENILDIRFHFQDPLSGNK